MHFMAVFLCLAAYHTAVDQGPSVFKMSPQYLSLTEIQEINMTLGVKDSWVAPSGRYTVTGRSMLTQVDKHFREASGELDKGVWWNTNEHPVLIQYQKRSFLLPANATLVIGKYAAVSRESRPMMLQGGARNRVDFEDLKTLNIHSIPVRSDAAWHNFLDQASNDTNHPLHHFSQAEMNKTREGIVFHDGTVAGLVYETLQDQLSEDVFDQVLRQLGLSVEYLAARHDGGETRADKYCHSKGSCAPQNKSTCTSSC